MPPMNKNEKTIQLIARRFGNECEMRDVGTTRLAPVVLERSVVGRQGKTVRSCQAKPERHVRREFEVIAVGELRGLAATNPDVSTALECVASGKRPAACASRGAHWRGASRTIS